MYTIRSWEERHGVLMARVIACNNEYLAIDARVRQLAEKWAMHRADHVVYEEAYSASTLLFFLNMGQEFPEPPATVVLRHKVETAIKERKHCAERLAVARKDLNKFESGWTK